MPEITLNSIKINYEDKGEGFPLILVHGLSDDLRFWDPLTSELSRHYRTIALDLRGHGKSSKPGTPYSIGQFSRDIHSLITKLGIKKAGFIGFSMGGAVAQEFTVVYPEMVSSLVLISSFSYANPDLNNALLKLRESLFEGGFASFFDGILPMVLTPQFIRQNRAALQDVKEEKIKTESPAALINAIDACLEFDIRNSLQVVSKPTLIISGKEDILTPTELAEQTQKLIKHSNLEIIKNTRHNVLIPQNTPYLLELIMKFLKNV